MNRPHVATRLIVTYNSDWSIHPKPLIKKIWFIPFTTNKVVYNTFNYELKIILSIASDLVFIKRYKWTHISSSDSAFYQLLKNGQKPLKLEVVWESLSPQKLTHSHHLIYFSIFSENSTTKIISTIKQWIRNTCGNLSKYLKAKIF